VRYVFLFIFYENFCPQFIVIIQEIYLLYPVKNHKDISFLHSPVVWVKVRYFNGLSKGELAFIVVFPFFGVFGLIADFVTIGKITSDSISILLAYMLFGYGLINIIFVRELIKTSGRLQNERLFYKVLHKDVVEELREYRTYRKCVNGVVSDVRIKEKIKHILTSFNNNYIKKKYSSKVVATIKYKLNDKLYPIRVGDDANSRDSNAEEECSSYVYQALNEIGRTLPYIYVKNLDKLDAYESGVMGRFTDKIKGRAGSNYKTFIALPIRGGKLPDMGVDVRANLGVIGFDLNEKYGFGDFGEHELDYIACLADSLSELIEDLVAIP
jgi:hypothetical protein